MARYAQDPRLSTFYDPAASITNFQTVQTVQPPGGETEYHVDMLHHKTLRAVQQLPTVAVIQYQGTEHITTIAFTYFKTTSYWWLLMLYNGLVHPLEIVPGTLIRVPDHTVFEDRIQEARVVRQNSTFNPRTVTI